MHIDIRRIGDNEGFSIALDPNFNTIMAMKKYIFQIYRFPVQDQYLLYKQMLLRDNESFTDYDINEGSIVYLVALGDCITPFVTLSPFIFLLSSIVIKVQSLEERSSFVVTPRFTIGDVRMMIQAAKKISWFNHLLLYNYRALEDESLTLEENGVESNATLYLVGKGLPLLE